MNDERWYLCIYPYYWGRGKTHEEAKANARKQGGRGTNWVTYIMPEGAEDPYVDGYGYIGWKSERDGQMMVFKHGREFKNTNNYPVYAEQTA